MVEPYDFSLGLGYSIFELPQEGGAFSFDNLNRSFCRILDVVQSKGALVFFHIWTCYRQSLFDVMYH
jgi:hypothetical protein